MGLDIIYAILIVIVVIGLIFLGYKTNIDSKHIKMGLFIIGGLTYINSKLNYDKQDIVKTTLEYLYMAAKLIGTEDFSSVADLKIKIITQTDLLCEKNGIEKLDFNEPFIDIALDYVIQEMFNIT